MFEISVHVVVDYADIDSKILKATHRLLKEQLAVNSIWVYLHIQQ